VAAVVLEQPVAIHTQVERVEQVEVVLEALVLHH